MNLISRYRIIIAVVFPFLVFIAIRSCSKTSFKYDANRWAQPSYDFSNVISESAMEKLTGEKLIINLDNTSGRPAEKSVTELRISPDSILNKKFISAIRAHEGPVLLSSEDQSLSARVWILITQTGCRNIYILTNSSDNEVFKCKFRPDTLKPEL